MGRSRRAVAPPTPAGAGIANRVPWWPLAYLSFSILLLVLALPLFSGAVEPRWDARDLNYPAFVYLSDSLREGRLPMWDPYTNCGYPFHADPLLPTLNPAGMILGFLAEDTPLAFTLYWLFHWWLAGAGTIWLSRGLGCRPAGALLAASAYAFSGFFIGLPQITPLIVSAGWIPWILGAADRAVSERNWGWAVLGGCLYGVSQYGGYPGIGTFTGLSVVLWLAFRHLPDPPPTETYPLPLATRGIWIAGTVGILGVLCLTIWSPVLSSFFSEGAGYTDRVEPLSPGSPNFGGDAFTLPAHLSLFFPFAVIAGKEWMGADITMTNGYVGALTVPLAAFLFLRGDGRRRPWWLLGFLLFHYLLSLGPTAGVRTVLHYLYPPMRYVRYSAIFKVYWQLALAVAAGLGLSRLLDAPGERKTAFAILAGWTCLGLAAAIALRAAFLSHGTAPEALFPRAYLPAALILPAAVAAAWGAHAGGNGAFGRWCPVILLILALADMGGHLRNNEETAWVERDSIRQAEAYRVRSTAVPGEPGPRLPPGRFRFFNVQQIIKRPIVKGYVAMRSNGFDEVLCNSSFAQVLGSPVRFWLTPAEPLLDRDSALAALAATGAGGHVPAFVDGDTGGIPPGRAVPGTVGSVSVARYSPEQVKLDVFVPGPSPLLLASTERYSAGWRASVDGVARGALRTNLYFRGVPVPPGRHEVLWEYEPAFWKPLLLLGGGVLISCIILAGFLITRRQPPPRAPWKRE